MISNTSTLNITNYKENSVSKDYNILITNSYTIEGIEASSTTNSSETIDLQNRNIENVTVEIIEDTITKSGATVVITDNNEIPYSWDENFYRIEKKINGNWQDINSNKPMDSLLIGYLRNENNQIKFNINWSSDYGTLDAGTYRILEIATEGSIIAYSNEFQIY